MKIEHQKIIITSTILEQQVEVEIYHPQGDYGPLPLLILHDGQDLEKMKMTTILRDCWSRSVCRPFVLVAPHAHKRMQWYGVAHQPDYKKRGDQAAAHQQFITQELLPHLSTLGQLPLTDEKIVAGFSLGGLSAFDLGWRHPQIFRAIGVFSGSFWWRSKDLKDGYTDLDRIAHSQVRATTTRPDLRIWLQCGTLDEEADRNHNGIIDSVDDTEDMIRELLKKGFHPGKDLHYELTIGGKHTLETYGILLPLFLRWAYPV